MQVTKYSDTLRAYTGKYDCTVCSVYPQLLECLEYYISLKCTAETATQYSVTCKYSPDKNKNKWKVIVSADH